MGVAELVGDVFAGVAATAGLLSVRFARRTVNEAKETTGALRTANLEAKERFKAEDRHRLLAQFQTVSDLLAELSETRMLGIEPQFTTLERQARYQAIRRQLVAAVIVLRDLGGDEMGGMLHMDALESLANMNIGVATNSELVAAQEAIIGALKSL